MKFTTVILALALASIATGCSTKSATPAQVVQTPIDTTEQSREDNAKRGWLTVAPVTLADAEKK